MVVLLILFVLTFGVFFTKRRFGLIALVLLTGSLLNSLWGSSLVSFLEANNFSLNFVSPIELVSIVLILLPAIFLLSGGPTYGRRSLRFAVAILVFILATTLLAGVFNLSESSNFFEGVVKFLQMNSVYVITFCAVIALIDIYGAFLGRARR